MNILQYFDHAMTPLSILNKYYIVTDFMLIENNALIYSDDNSYASLKSKSLNLFIFCYRTYFLGTIFKIANSFTSV